MHPELEQIAAALTDGRPVDWAAALSAAGDEATQRHVAQLQVVAKMFRVYRELDADASPGGEPDGGSPMDVTSPLIASGTRWGSLQIVECIGRGTFGDVYRARDLRLDREVAVKLLRVRDRPHALASEVVHEGRLLARVRHPNVVTVYGADRSDGLVGVWMELIEGQTLEEELLVRGPLAPEAAAGIGETLCRALAAVHDAGLLHRDIKPQNVMRDGRSGRIVLTDFSAGRELCVRRTGDARLPHSIAGSPLYLAPEVIAGQPATERSDIYSLGVLLFRLITGEFPVTGRSLTEIADAHAIGERQPLSACRPDTSPAVAAAVTRAIAPEPADRFGSAAEMAEAIAAATRPSATATRARRLWTIGFAGLALAATLTAVPTITRSPAPGGALSNRPVVLIAGFDNLSGDQSVNAIVEGALAEALAASPSVAVASAQLIAPVLARMRKPPDARLDARVARELVARDAGIRALVAGSVQKDAEGFLLAAEIINPADGGVVARIDEKVPAGFTLPEHARRLAGRLRALVAEVVPKIAPATRQLEPVTTSSLQALQWYSQAASMLNGHVAPPQPQDYQAAEALLQQAVDADPEFASAWLLLAQVTYAQHLQERLHLPPLDAAVRHSATVPDTERLLIAAIAHRHRASLTGSIREFESAIRAYESWLDREGLPRRDIGVRGSPSPRDDVVPELEALYREVGRIADADALVLRTAAALPNSIRLAAKVAQIELRRGNAAASRAGTDRVLAAARSDFPDRNISDVAWARLWDAHHAWLGGDPAGALSALERAERQWSEDAIRPRAQWAFHLSNAYSGLGRFTRAEEIISSFGPQRIERGVVVVDENRRRRDVARVAFRRGDLRRARELLAPATTFEDLNPSSGLLVWIGLLDKAEFVVAEHKRGKLGPNWMLCAVSEGLLRVAQGRYREGLRRLEPVTTAIHYGVASTWAREYAARAHRALGDLDAAIRVLEPIEEQRAAAVIGNWTVDDWLRARVLLAESYREAGRTADFDRVAADVRRLLAMAEPGHPLLDRLDAQ